MTQMAVPPLTPNDLAGRFRKLENHPPVCVFKLMQQVLLSQAGVTDSEGLVMHRPRSHIP